MNQMVTTKKAKVQFNWQDPFLIEQQLTEDERMIREMNRTGFVGESIF